MLITQPGGNDMSAPTTRQDPHDPSAVFERPPGRREALVVYESMFGNTAEIATAVSCGLAREGFTVTTVEVSTAPALADTDTDLVVVGGPTHAFSLSRRSTRDDAVRQGAPAARASAGLREWLAAGARAHPPQQAAAFDTRVGKVRFTPKSAATGSARRLRAMGFTLIVPPEGFVVSGVAGSLLPGERERAVLWGRDLARTFAVQ
jgi:hypothetical protein